jgi:hypothetical protein
MLLFDLCTYCTSTFTKCNLCIILIPYFLQDSIHFYILISSISSFAIVLSSVLDSIISIPPDCERWFTVWGVLACCLTLEVDQPRNRFSLEQVGGMEVWTDHGCAKRPRMSGRPPTSLSRLNEGFELRVGWWRRNSSRFGGLDLADAAMWPPLAGPRTKGRGLCKERLQGVLPASVTQ